MKKFLDLMATSQICFHRLSMKCILMLTLNQRGETVLYINTCIACCGLFPALRLILSWRANNIGSLTKRFIAVGFVTGIGQIDGITMPLVQSKITNQSTKMFQINSCEIPTENVLKQYYDKLNTKKNVLFLFL